MRFLIFAAIALIIFGCNDQPKEQTATRELSFPEVGWKITVPSDFTVMDSAQIQELNNKGINAIEKTYDTAINTNATRTLLSINKGEFNMLQSTVTQFDEATDGNWSEANTSLKTVVIETMKSQTPLAKLDTTSTTEKIGDLDFEKFNLTVTYPNNMILHMLMYSRLQKGFDFGITITYVDEKVGDRLKAIFASSKFQ